MEWSKLFDKEKQPTALEISQYINSPLWENLLAFLQESYDVSPSYSYSSCSEQPGWNIKYKKAGRSLCTLYPMSGFFIALVVIGANEEFEAEALMPSYGEYIQELLTESKSSSGERWLMVEVTDCQVLDDTKALIRTRRKPNL
jgi:hypothetical protein